MAGEPEEELEAGGGGRGPCCWAIAGIPEVVPTLASKTISLAVREEVNIGLASFANMFISSLGLPS